MLTLPAEDVIPGTTIVAPGTLYHRERMVLVVTTIKIYQDTWYVSNNGRYTGPAVLFNGDDRFKYQLGTKVGIIPARPVVDVKFNLDHEAWDIKIKSDGDVYITLNGAEIGNGVIKVYAEREDAVKEISA